MGISIVTPLMRIRGARLRNWKVVHAHLKPFLWDDEIEWIVPEQGSDFGQRFRTQKVPVFGRKCRSAMRNIGWRQAKHEMICFLDSDVVMTRGAWEHAFRECWKYDVYSPYRRGVKLGPKQTRNRVDSIIDGNWRFRLPEHEEWNLCGGICFIRKRVLEDVLGWDERFTGWGYEDIALEKLIKQRFHYHLDQNLAVHLFHPTTPKKKSEGRQMRRLFRREYAGRTFFDIITRRKWHDELTNNQMNQLPMLVDRKQGDIDGLVAVTSLTMGEEKRERQQKCLDSWRRLGLRIVAVQLPGQIEQLQPYFPAVEFVMTNRSHAEYQRVLIKDHAMQAVRLQTPVMLINSDIEIYQNRDEFVSQWVDVPDDTMQFGVRWNYHSSLRHADEEQWGIDAFRFTPQTAEQLPDYGFGIGLPVWDFWLPWHHKRVNQGKMRTDPRPVMFHQNHLLNWTVEDHARGCKVMKRVYNVDKPELDDWIAGMRFDAKQSGMEVFA